MDPIFYFLIIFIAIIASAFFSASETALLRLRKEHLEKDLKEAKGPAAFVVRDLLHSPSRLLTTILFGNNVANIVGAASASALAIHFFGDKWGVLIASVVMTVVLLLFSEILPKAMGAHNPKRISFAVGIPLYLIHKLLKPVHYLIDKVLDPLVRALTGRGEEGMDISEEILAMAKRASMERNSGSPLAIISSTAGAAELTVEEIMTPRTEIVAFPAEISPSALLDQLLHERFTRVPIYEGNLDKIMGVVHLKELIELVREGRGDIREIIKPVLRVPEKKSILPLLTEMQRSLIHMAIVKDEFGVTQGLVTSEDILEEIVGEIRDEFDMEELHNLKQLSDGSYEADGLMYIADFNRDTGWCVPAESGETLSGLVFNQLGHIPKKNQLIRVENYRFTVLEVAGSRVVRVRVKRKSAGEEIKEDNFETEE